MCCVYCFPVRVVHKVDITVTLLSLYISCRHTCYHFFYFLLLPHWIWAWFRNIHRKMAIKLKIINLTQRPFITILKCVISPCEPHTLWAGVMFSPLGLTNWACSSGHFIECCHFSLSDTVDAHLPPVWPPPTPIQHYRACCLTLTCNVSSKAWVYQLMLW